MYSELLLLILFLFLFFSTYFAAGTTVAVEADRVADLVTSLSTLQEDHAIFAQHNDIMLAMEKTCLAWPWY